MNSGSGKAVELLASIIVIAAVGFGLAAMVFGNVNRKSLEAKEAKYEQIVKDMENDVEHDRIASIMHGDDMRMAARIQ